MELSPESSLSLVDECWISRLANMGISQISDILQIDCVEDDNLDDLQQPDIDTLKTMLSRNKHYFISWSGSNYSNGLRKEFLTKPSDRKLVLETLLVNLVPPRSPYKFETYEYEPNCSVAQDIVAFFIEAFIFLENVDTVAASKLIYMGKWFTEYCLSQKYIDADYLLGVKYLCRWLKLHVNVLIFENKVSSKWRFKPRDENEYEMLSDKSKTIVLAAKCYFLSSLRYHDPNARTEAEDCLRLIVIYDPENFIWNSRLANWLRFNRRRAAIRSITSCPGVEEIDRLWKAYECCLNLSKRGGGEIFENIALSMVCQGIAEIIRWRINTQIRDDPIQVGFLCFENTATALTFVLQNVHLISSNEDSQFPELIRAGEIVSNILPKEYRDLNLAEELLTRAWKLSPANSKINHKLGVLHVSKNQLEQSLEYFRNAVEYSSANFPAIMDLLKTLMSFPYENLKEIDEVFKSAFKEKTFSENEKTKIRVIQGCFKFILGAQEDAIKIWLQAHKSNPSLNVVKDLYGYINRYHWPKDQIIPNDVKTSLENYLKRPYKLEDSDRTVLHKLTGTIRYANVPEVSLSDADMNWRQPSATSSRCGGGDQQPSKSSSSDTTLNRSGPYAQNQRNRLSNPAYRRNFDENRANANRQRPPSPESWR